MNEVYILKDIIIVLAVSIPIIYLFNKVNIPSIIGFIVTGILIGPNVFRLIKNPEGINHLAELGIALLLFTIGIEISFNSLLKNFKELLFIGSLQVIVTIAAGFLIGMVSGLSPQKAIFLGFLITHSSSAIVLKMIYDRDEIDSPYGKIVIGTLVFQDLMILPMMLLIPILGISAEGSFIDAFLRLTFSFGLIVLIFLIARFLMPYILYQLIHIQMRDVFIIGIIVLCLGTAFITQSFSLSFAIGAFIAGLIISETDYTHQVVGNIMPFKEVFTSFFFISFGMLLDVHLILKNPVQIISILLVVMILKTLIMTGIVTTLRTSIRIAILTGFYLSQIGEFSFVLALKGLEYSLIEKNFYNNFIAVTILTMIVSPIILKISPILSTKIPQFKKKSLEISKGLKNHVIIIGFGLNGKNIARVLKEVNIPFIIIEANYNTAKDALKTNEPVIIGDATNKEILNQANLKSAKIAVLVVSDPMTIRITTRLIKEINPNIFLIVRTRYVKDVDDLKNLGADEVIPEEFETSIQILGRVLKQYHLPNSVILAQANTLRTESYGIFRDIRFTEHAFDQINQILAQGTIDTVFINKDSEIVGKTLKEINLRDRTNATVISVIRNNEFIPNPSGNFTILENDLLVLFGTHNAIDKATEILTKGYIKNDQK